MLKFFAAALAVFGLTSLASCSSDEPINGSGNGSEVMNGDSYIAVRIVNPMDGTRAFGEATDAGTDAERKIKNIAFYFFNNDGTPFLMEEHSESVNGTNVYSNKIKPAFSLDGSSGTLNTTLVLGKSKDNGWNGPIPSKMVAVANLKDGDPAFQKLANKNLSDLLSETQNAQGNASLTGSSSYFIMTSSTYSANNEVIYWNEIGLDNIRTDAEVAKEHPVIVHLERLVAKVTLNLVPDPDKVIADNRFIVAERPIYDESGNQVTKKFYAEIIGWDLNATSRASYLFKHVDASKVPFSNWNDLLNSRSYWAESYYAAPFNTYKTSLKKDFIWANIKQEPGTSLYCYENTKEATIDRRQNAETDATKVLLRAQITDEDGTPLDLISWAGMLYTVDDFKEYVAQQKSEDPTDKDKVHPELVTFKRGDDAQQKHHVVSAYYNGELMPQFANIRLWTKGACYYVINIQHTIDNKGIPVYGVVRNHSYRVNVNSITGLGTPGGYDDPKDPENPTPDPGDHDDPENPDPEVESFVAAKVEVLNWHIIENDVDVES